MTREKLRKVTSLFNLSYKKNFYLILSLGLLARIYVAFFSGLGWYGHDTNIYLNMARGIVEGNPVSFFPNGFPLLLAGIMLLTEDNTAIILVVLNIVLQILTVIMMEKILTRYNVEEKVRLLAVLLVALYPHTISNVRFIYTESSALFLIVLSIFLYTYKKFPASGFIGYLSYTFRPSLFLVSPFLIIYNFFRKKKKTALRIAIGFIAGMLFFTLLEWSGVISPSSNQYFNTLVAVSGSGYNLDFELKNFTDDEVKHPVKTYFNFIVAHPIEYTKQRILSLWSLWGPVVRPTNTGMIGMILHGLRFPVFVLAVCAFFFRKKMKHDEKFILLLFFPVLSVTFIHFFTFSSERHQFTAEPFAVVLSVLFVEYLIEVRKRLKEV